jgi:hypothetical protein
LAHSEFEGTVEAFASELILSVLYNANNVHSG